MEKVAEEDEFYKRRVSTKSTHPAGDIEEVKRTFLTGILETVEFYDIPLNSFLTEIRLGSI